MPLSTAYCIGALVSPGHRIRDSVRIRFAIRIRFPIAIPAQLTQLYARTAVYPTLIHIWFAHGFNAT